ncbi:MAG: glycosyltransferase family 2 protein [Mycobacteriales bacterium]
MADDGRAQGVRAARQGHAQAQRVRQLRGARALSSATVLVVTWEGAHLLPACLDAVLPEGAPVLVVDNASTDGTADLLASRYPQVQVVRTAANLGFAGGVVTGLEHVTTPYVVLLNSDATVRSGWLKELLKPLEDPLVAAVTSKLLLPDGRLNSAGGYLEPTGYGHDLGFGEPDCDLPPADVAYGCGAALALRMDAVREVGGMDPKYFLYYEDVDLSWRLWLAGYRVVFQPTAVVEHQHSATTGGGKALLHTYFTERNRLATLVTCATWGLAVRMLLRYPLTTLSVALGESRAKAWARARALGSLLVWLPTLLKRRRAVVTRLSRQAYEARFLSAPSIR